MTLRRLCRQRVAHALKRVILLSAVIVLVVPGLQAQHTGFLARPDSLDQTRFWVATGATAAIYTGTVIGLNEIWYDQYARTSFHFFNDWGEWKNMDKMGHLYTAYFESQWLYSIARWTGVQERPSTWIGAGMGVVLQSTIEVLDGFSEKWGFSIPDFAFNVLGAGTFFAQQRLWSEQRILLKVSGTPRQYPPIEIPSASNGGSTTLRARANDLYGTGFFERFIKDYNEQTVWASVNLSAFVKTGPQFPGWLNIAFGYGAENLFGGFENTWEDEGRIYILDDPRYDRYGQFYLAPDIDFSRIPSKSPLVRTLLGMLNVIKLPAPALEINRVDGVRFHLIHF
ncbi:MAG: DUF2279 domain-containing protein [Saprospiraceae bacterium]|nr:DUF2279 domain-containing protein [Saprospiraceae bacterium]